MRTFTSRALAAGLAAAALAVAAPAAAQVDPESRAAAREHFAEGRRLVDAGDMRAAYAEFEAGYRLSGRPLFLFNMAECARQSDQPERARADYERYLAEEAPGGAMIETARARLRALESAPAPDAGEPNAPGDASAEEPTPAAALPAVTLPDDGGPPSAPLDPDTDEAGGGDDDAWIVVLTVLALGALAGAGVALGVYFGTQGPECGPGCVDFR